VAAVCFPSMASRFQTGKREKGGKKKKRGYSRKEGERREKEQKRGAALALKLHSTQRHSYVGGGPERKGRRKREGNVL